jgi:DNA-binding transcriptional ArsR family regulator
MQPFGCMNYPTRCDVNLVFKALADPGRRTLLDQLHRRNGQSLNELCRHLSMSRQAVSKHLRLLHRANLVVHLWRGREKLHYINPVPLKEILERWIEKYPSHIPVALRDLERGLHDIDAARLEPSN